MLERIDCWANPDGFLNITLYYTPEDVRPSWHSLPSIPSCINQTPKIREGK